MKTNTKILIYPGNHGHASYCYYQVAFNAKNIRPKVVILIWDSNDSSSTPINNNPITDDLIVNRILERECEGIAVTDLLAITPHTINCHEPTIKVIPLVQNESTKPTKFELAKSLFKSIKESDKHFDRINRKYFRALTKDPRPIESAEAEIVEQLFPMMNSSTGILEFLDQTSRHDNCD